MTRSIPWPRIFAEGFAIVVSILLAFGIQAWWEGRQERGDELRILEGLGADFRANREELNRVTGLHEDFQSRLVALQRLPTSELELVPDEEMDSFSRAMQGTPTFDPQDATLDAALASGDLGTIRDPHLRDLLAQWKAQVEDLEEEAADFREVSARARDRIGELGGPWVFKAEGHSLSTGPQSESALSAFSAPDLVLAANDRELQDILRVKRFNGVIYLRWLSPLDALADSILEALDRAS